jgi:two-component system LytT family response regulator
MKQNIHTLIIDDESQSRLLIRKLLEDFTDTGFIIQEAHNIKEALEKMNLTAPQLVFLDIRMQGETGFDLLDKLRNWNFEIIFITAHSEFAIRAFRYCALDYLLKPIDKNEFGEAIQKAVEKIRINRQDLKHQFESLKEQLEKKDNNIRGKLFIPTSEGIIFLEIPGILYCSALNNYTEFNLQGKQKIVSSQTLGYYSELLEPHQFFRIHRSYLVNLNQILMYRRADGGSVVMKDGKEIEISRNHKESFLKLFKPQA